MELYAIHPTYAIPYLEAIENASTEDRAAAAAAFGDEPLPELVARTESGEAVITISGPLSPAGPSPIARFFGYKGTGYIDIISAAKSLENDPGVTKVRIAMDTIGGSVSGMDQARQAIESLASKKTVVVENHGGIHSAGVYLATAKGVTEIVAMSPIVEMGSIGIARVGFDTSEALARNGVKRIKIISSNAPNKQSDPTTVKGIQVHQDDVDAVERVFIAKVAEGRGTTESDVIENFGKGGTLIAQDPDPDKPDALKVGMIDRVITGALVVQSGEDNDDSETNAVNIDGKQKGTIMDLAKLEAEHPAVYAQAVAVGNKQGIADERKRVNGHVAMGEACGDMKLAMKNVTDGVEHSTAVNAIYQAAQMNKLAVENRAGESEVDIDTEGAGSDDTGEDNDKVLAKAVAEKMGVDYDA